MGPVRCHYQDCTNFNENKSVFSFPIKDETRLKIWIEHAGNGILACLTHKQLKRRFLCEDHFNERDIKRNCSRCRLSPSAVPRMYGLVKSPCLEMKDLENPKVQIPQEVREHSIRKEQPQKDHTKKCMLKDPCITSKRDSPLSCNDLPVIQIAQKDHTKKCMSKDPCITSKRDSPLSCNDLPVIQVAQKDHTKKCMSKDPCVTSKRDSPLSCNDLPTLQIPQNVYTKKCMSKDPCVTSKRDSPLSCNDMSILQIPQKVYTKKCISKDPRVTSKRDSPTSCNDLPTIKDTSDKSFPCIDLPMTKDPSDKSLSCIDLTMIKDPSDKSFPCIDLPMPEDSSASESESSILDEPLYPNFGLKHDVVKGKKDNPIHQPMALPALWHAERIEGDKLRKSKSRKNDSHKNESKESESKLNGPYKNPIAKIAVLQNKISKLKERVRDLSMRSNKKKMMFFETLPFPSQAAKTLAAMQLRGPKKKKKWTKEERDLSLSIFSRSKSTYYHLKKQGIVLPGKATVQLWSRKMNSTDTTLESNEKLSFDFVNCDSDPHDQKSDQIKS